MTQEEFEAAVERARSTSSPATSSRSCCRSASRRRMPPRSVRHLPRAARDQPVAVHVLPRASATSRSSAPRPRCWCGGATAASRRRPIAGTRPRGATDAEDDAPRGRAARRSEGARRARDAGRPRPQRRGPRVARSGTVQRRRAAWASSATRTSCTSSRNVRGRAAPRARRGLDVLRATFPAGTVSGAPEGARDGDHRRARADARGLYGGAVGYFGFDGNMDTCIAIRTLVCQGGVAYVQAGAGIVADSVPRARVRGDA